MRSRILTTLSVLGIALMPVGLWAGGHGASGPSDDEVLIAIKEALVDEARAAETRVVNLAWLDAAGQMHESTVLQSDTRVRGVQVKRYLDEAKKPQIEVALDEKQAAMPACFAHDDHLRRMVRVTTDLDTRTPGVSTLAGQLLNVARAELVDGFEGSSLWSMTANPLTLDPYTTVLTGYRQRPSHYVIQLSARAMERPATAVATAIPGSDPLSTYVWGRPSMFPEQWILLQVALSDVRTDELVWQAEQAVMIPPRPVSYGGESLPEPAMTILQGAVERWLAELDGFALCTPFALAFIPSAEDRLVVDGGRRSGVQVGDRVLIMDRRHVPQRVLEPGVLSTLALARVTRVSESQAELVSVAGAPLDDLEHKVALPF